MLSDSGLYQVVGFWPPSATGKSKRRSSKVLTVMLAGLATLGCRDSSAPEPFAAKAVALVAESPIVSSAVVATMIATAPAVRAVDMEGKPVKGADVRFAVTAGGGSVGEYTVTTNESGIAKLSRWTLGRTAGENIIVASLDSFAIEFHAVGVAGDPHQLVKLSGDYQIGAAGQPLPHMPRVRVEDLYRNGVAAVQVEFSVTAGGGSVASGTALTDRTGMAILDGWILGPSGGQVLSARTGTVTAQTFTATVPELPFACDGAVPLVAGVEQIAVLGAGPCRSGDGKFFRMYSLAVTQTAAWQLDSRSNEFITSLQIFGGGGEIIAAAQGDDTSEGSTILALLPPGPYTVVVSSARPFDLGAFGIRARLMAEANPCWPLFITASTSISGTVPLSQCGPNPIVSKVLYRVHLMAGHPITATLTDRSYSGPILELSNSAGIALKRGENSSTYVQSITFSPTATGFYDLTVVDPFSELAQYEFVLK